ncbi:MAG: trigger factor [Ignavibacteria bacterium RBG_16_36_9]|nr:MAG: trigger factor [Ignavibacteria bacterium RBG_16_36_9]
MEIKVNDISQSEKEVEVTLSYDEIRNEIDREVKKEISKIQVPGFRKGKVPKQIIKQRFRDTLEFEASEKVANSRFWQLAKENDLRPIGQPVMTDLDFNIEKDFKFKVKYEVIPEIEVKAYTNQVIEVPDLNVKPNDVEKEIDNLLRSNSSQEDADAIGDDDNFLLDVELTRIDENGQPATDNKPEKLQIDLSNENVHSDIKTNARGKKVGEKFKFHFHDERMVQNKDGQEEKVVEHFDYEVLILGIKKIVLPELNEELIKKATKDKFTTEEELRTEIEKNIQSYYDQRVDEFTRNKLIGLIISKNDFTPPSFMVESILDEMVKSEEERLKKQGMKKVDTKYLREYLQSSALNEVKWFQLKTEIQKKENLEVTDKELEELAAKDAEKTGLPVDKLINYYRSSNQAERMLDKKLFDFLKEKNKINKVNPEKFSQKQKEEKE